MVVYITNKYDHIIKPNVNIILYSHSTQFGAWEPTSVLRYNNKVKSTTSLWGTIEVMIVLNNGLDAVTEIRMKTAWWAVDKEEASPARRDCSFSHGQTVWKTSWMQLCKTMKWCKHRSTKNKAGLIKKKMSRW